MDDILSLCANVEAVNRIRAHRRRIAALLDRGVVCPCPESIEIADDVDIERIHPTVTLHARTRISGARTSIGPHVVLGREAPVALEDCVLGPNVILDGGFYRGVTMLDGANTRSGAHVREGTLFEERASAAHCVGLKQTILFPYVTLGSLINFCDCLMAGGTGRKDHSEVGSGYIHFNFTPRGDKVTPSLFGDVPRGVLLDQPRIFLGGLAASVGPMRVGFGAFLGPGAVYRRDVKEGRFQLSEKPIQMEMDFDPKVLAGLPAKLRKTFRYIGNLAALWQWYRHVRPLFAGPERTLLYDEARKTVEAGIEERIKQIGRMVSLVPESLERLQAGGAPSRTLAFQRRLLERWPTLRETLSQFAAFSGSERDRDTLLEVLAKHAAPGDYLQVVPALPSSARQAALRWLEDVVSSLARAAEQAVAAE